MSDNIEHVEIRIINPILNRLPQYATDGSAAVDLCACINNHLIIRPGQVISVSAGIALSMPNNMAGLLLPRSGLSRQGLVLGNSVGLIDSDYQGEVKVLLWNRNQTRNGTINMPEPITVNPFDRIAQLMFVPVIRPQLAHVQEFKTKTVRGEGGFGSTGVSSERSERFEINLVEALLPV